MYSSFTSFPNIVLFLFQNPILHISLFQCVTVLQSLLVFSWPWEFWRGLVNYFVCCLSIGLLWWFLRIRLRLYIFGKSTIECLSKFVTVNTTSVCFISGNNNFDNLVQTVCVRFLHYKVSNFLFIIKKNWWIYLRL